MRIEGIIWLSDIVDKIAYKHRVETAEVEEAFSNQPNFLFVEKGDREGENIYLALGQANSGRYLSVIFVLKLGHQALILSARDMAQKEGRRYGRK